MADEPRWKAPRPQAMEQEENLFDVLGEEGEQFKPPSKKTDNGPRLTEKAAEKLKVHNESNNTPKDRQIDPAKIKGSGKDGAITANDVQQEIGKQSREKAQAAAMKAQGKQEEPEEYDKDRVVYYAGHQIAVPSRRMRLEEVRIMIEDQFPELSKANTDMIYDEEKGAVIPVLKGHRKGAKRVLSSVRLDADREDLNGPVSYVLGADGYTYVVRHTQAGTFVTRMDGGSLVVTEGFRLNVPLVPATLLRKAIERFKEHAAQGELLCNFVWDAERKRYVLHWPDQTGTVTSVEASGMMETDDRFIVLQMHSHGILPAFFSATDDADDIRTGLYAVVGHCDLKWPDILVRYSCGGVFREVKPANVFGIGWSGIVEHESRKVDVPPLRTGRYIGE